MCNYYLYVYKTRELKSRARVLHNKTPGFLNAGKISPTCIGNVRLVRKTENGLTPVRLAPPEGSLCSGRPGPFPLSLPDVAHI